MFVWVVAWEFVYKFGVFSLFWVVMAYIKKKYGCWLSLVFRIFLLTNLVNFFNRRPLTYVKKKRKKKKLLDSNWFYDRILIFLNFFFLSFFFPCHDVDLKWDLFEKTRSLWWKKIYEAKKIFLNVKKTHGFYEMEQLQKSMAKCKRFHIQLNEAKHEKSLFMMFDWNCN